MRERCAICGYPRAAHDTDRRTCQGFRVTLPMEADPLTPESEAEDRAFLDQVFDSNELQTVKPHVLATWVAEVDRLRAELSALRSSRSPEREAELAMLGAAYAECDAAYSEFLANRETARDEVKQRAYTSRTALDKARDRWRKFDRASAPTRGEGNNG